MSGATSAISLASTVASAGSGIVGSYYSARGQRDNLNYQADIADTNARIAELGAQSALMAGQRQIAAQTIRAGQLKGAQRVALAANGVDLGVGSAAELQASTEVLKEIDKNTLEANAVRNAWGYRTQGVNAQNEARMARAGASSINPAMSAGTTLLSSAGSVAESWYRYSESQPTRKIEYDSIDDLGSSKGWW